MGLILKLAESVINVNCKQIISVDNTGAYNDPNNLGGYGGAGGNELRTDLAIKAFLLLHKATGYEIIEAVAYNVTTAETFYHNITEDGHYELLGIGVYVYSAGPWAIGQVVYYNGNYYKVLVNTTSNIPTNTTDWKLITDPEDFQSGTNVFVSSQDFLVKCLAEKCLAGAIMALTSKVCTDSEEKRKALCIREQIEAATYNAGYLKWTQVEENILAIQQLCSDLNCMDCN